jgi:hypothetical protein
VSIEAVHPIQRQQHADDRQMRWAQIADLPGAFAISYEGTASSSSNWAGVWERRSIVRWNTSLRA